MHARAEQILTGAPMPQTRPWREVLAERESGRWVYQLGLDPVAEDQISACPRKPSAPLAELFTLLETAPWSGSHSTEVESSVPA